MKNIKHKNTIFLIAVLSLMTAWFYFNFPEKEDGRIENEIFPSDEEGFLEEVEPVGSDEESMRKQEGFSVLVPPMDRAEERVSKKPFGILISPRTSPIQPERFSGYHTGIDLEIFPEEAGVEIEVKSACAGEIISKDSANGYGGVVVQACELEVVEATIVYGHMKLSSIQKNVGDRIEKGEFLGFLGDAYSGETDGERKHLHFGIHKGGQKNILGYVKNKSDLSAWIDPCEYICKKQGS